jgi:hypothetical protein
MPYVPITDQNKVAAAQSAFPKDPKEMVNPEEDFNTLETAKRNYLNAVRDTNRVISNSTPATTGWRGMVAGLPGINYVTESGPTGVLRQNIESLRTTYGVKKLQENPKMFNPLTEKEFERVAGMAGALKYSGPETELDRQVAGIQQIFKDDYIKQLRLYKARYGKVPEGFLDPEESGFPTIKALPGFKPRLPQKK